MTDESNNGVKSTNRPESSNFNEGDINSFVEVSEHIDTPSPNSRKSDQYESEDMEASSSRVDSKAVVVALSCHDGKIQKNTDSDSTGKDELVEKETDRVSTPAHAFSNLINVHTNQYTCSLESVKIEICSDSDPYHSNLNNAEVLEKNPMAVDNDNCDKMIEPVNKNSESEKDLKDLVVSGCTKIGWKHEEQIHEKSVDVQNCSEEMDESQIRNQNEDHFNYFGTESYEHNKKIENHVEIKEDTETIKNNRYKIQEPTVDKECMQSSSDISKKDKLVDNYKDNGQELCTHTKIHYQATTTVTDGDKTVENSKDYGQELGTHTKTDHNATTALADGAVNTPESNEKSKAALAKARQWNTCDDEDEDTVYDYKEDKGFKKACEKYVYFWKNKDIYSQWHRSNFVVNDKTFNCAEQYMMYKKAELFEDTKIAKKILSEKNPKTIKSLGRQVRNFSEELWAANCLYIVKQANIAKFSQDDRLKKELFATYPKVLVEASPFDKVWGIGLAEDDCEAWDERKWRGKNLLGYILTEVCDELMCEARKIQEHEKREYLPYLLKGQTQEAERSNKQKEMESERRQHRKSRKEEHKSPDKDSEQSEKIVIGKTELSFNEIENPCSKGQDVLSDSLPPLNKNITKPKEDEKLKTEAAMDTENHSKKIKLENDSLGQTSTEGGKMKDKKEKLEHYSSGKQASKDNQFAKKSALPSAIENHVIDADKKTYSSAVTGFHGDQTKKRSGFQQEKGVLKYGKCDGNKDMSAGPGLGSEQIMEISGRQRDRGNWVKENEFLSITENKQDGTYGKCDGNKETSVVPLCNSLQRKEQFGQQGETLVKECGCDGNKDMSAGPGLSSEQIMEISGRQRDKGNWLKENEFHSATENKQDGTNDDELKSWEVV